MNNYVELKPLSRLYAYFSMGLGIVFLGFYFFEEQLKWWQSTSPKLLPIILTAYMALAVTNLIRAYRDVPATYESYQITLLTEVLLIGFLLLYIAPQQWDLALIMLLNVGLASSLVKQRHGYFLAAMATILVLSHTWVHGDNRVTDQLLSSTLVSVLFFLEVFVIQGLKNRLREAQSEAKASQSQLLSVARINDVIIERMQTGVCLVNESGRILRINRAAVERIGEYTAGEQIPPAIEERLRFWMQYQLQNHDTIELSDTAAGSIIVNFANIDSHSVLIFIEDKDTVTRRAHQFKLSSMGRMAASIAHEIRNPLNAVSHAAQLLQESPDLQQDDTELCNIILKQSSRMEQIIQNVLQISRRKTTSLQWIKLDNWLENFKTEFEQQHKVPLDIDGGDLDIRFDPSQLHQVLWNLCHNSVAYGHAAANAPILLKIDEHSGHSRLRIMDNGPGISPKEQEFLFEPFHTTSAQGTGLGLYIVKELCEANQAKIHYRNRHAKKDGADKGACFEILFAQSS
ncbi:HAMP domain-containing histidine kinase [Bermanella marisrubri]|uniref:histidine kinase n=1 Tax=Bermanella marisrubri TaxID=207949 RepID=Q1MYR2_9GAMM|nr:HAMP domain-containing sensor histidine kinase [Bermanella marisrubri]EAT11144.1 ATP-binding region, ATPase-like:Histidine kinase A, N-terminal [Oceanobacter sp. RED65] [Bermanella marisrubri]QIZ83465.1 HAMP domain-containing histidine kinase [Bermanella marisrubri]